MALKSEPSERASFSAKARARRSRRLNKLMVRAGLDGVVILDIGGTRSYWEMNAAYFEPGLIASVDIVNLDSPTEEYDVGGMHVFEYQGNALELKGRRLPSYDMVFSNSVIEHVGNLESQKTMADGIRSMAPYHFVQTPCRWFPVDPHFGLPFFDLMPLGLRTFLHTRFTLAHMPRTPDWLEARISCENTRLMKPRELRAAFPESRLLRERYLGLVKSYMMTNLPVRE